VVFTVPEIKLASIGCVYHYFEVDVEHEENFKFFLNYGILEDVYYVIMLASEPNFELPILANVEFHRITNEFRDIGGYIKGYKEICKTNDWDYIFFLNSGVLGPLPLERFAVSKEKWTDFFLNLFTDNIQLVGTSVCALQVSEFPHFKELIEGSPYARFISPVIATHIQSFFFCLKKEARHSLVELGFFDQHLEENHGQLIVNFEIALSQIILNSNSLWTIKSNLSSYSDLDLKNLESDPNETSYGGDPYYRGRYFGKTIEPSDAVFFKTTRGLLNSEELRSLRNSY
jgi:hypothetical protein